jgi:hypothetical protein
MSSGSRTADLATSTDQLLALQRPVGNRAFGAVKFVNPTLRHSTITNRLSGHDALE